MLSRRTRRAATAVALSAAAVLTPVMAGVAPAHAATVIGRDANGNPIDDTANYRATVCGDSSSPTSIYVRNNLQDLAPRLLLTKGQGYVDVRGYNEQTRGAWWWYSTGNDGQGHTFDGWVFLTHITNRDGTCHG